MSEHEQPENNFGVFVFLFLNVFFCLGAMNGTTFRTIGVLFDAKQAGPVLGWSSAIASYGAFVIPAMFGVSLGIGKPERTMYGLAGYYVFCGFLNFWYYGRYGAERPGV
jgi:NNP family nitrate/nitrite transporter-like MFS transporter